MTEKNVYFSDFCCDMLSCCLQNEAGQKLTESCQENALGQTKHTFPTTQEMALHMDITRWSIPKSDWLCSLQPKMEKFYTVSKNKTGSWLWLRSWAPYCKIYTKLKKVGETTVSFKNNLNQIPYDYTVEMTDIQQIRSGRQSTWRTMDGSL